MAADWEMGDRHDLHGAQEDAVHCLPNPGRTCFDRDRSDAPGFCTSYHPDCPGRGADHRRELCRDNRAGRISEAATASAMIPYATPHPPRPHSTAALPRLRYLWAAAGLAPILFIL